MSEVLEKVTDIIEGFSFATSSEFATSKAEREEIDNDTEYVLSTIKEWCEKAEVLDEIIKQIDNERNWITQDSPIGKKKVLLHTRIGLYTHGQIKRMRSDVTETLEERIKRNQSPFPIYDFDGGDYDV